MDEIAQKVRAARQIKKSLPVRLGEVSDADHVCPFARAVWCLPDEGNLDLHVWKGGEKFHCAAGSLKLEQALWYEERGLLVIEMPTPEDEAAYRAMLAALGGSAAAPAPTTPDRVVTVDNPEHLAEIARLRAQLAAQPEALPVADIADVPEAIQALAQPGETPTDLQARFHAELQTLRSMLIGKIPMNEEQLRTLDILEHDTAVRAWLAAQN